MINPIFPCRVSCWAGGVTEGGVVYWFIWMGTERWSRLSWLQGFFWSLAQVASDRQTRPACDHPASQLARHIP